MKIFDGISQSYPAGAESGSSKWGADQWSRNNIFLKSGWRQWRQCECGREGGNESPRWSRAAAPVLCPRSLITALPSVTHLASVGGDTGDSLISPSHSSLWTQVRLRLTTRWTAYVREYQGMLNQSNCFIWILINKRSGLFVRKYWRILIFQGLTWYLCRTELSRTT